MFQNKRKVKRNEYTLRIGRHPERATCVDDHHLRLRFVWFGGIDVNGSVIHTLYSNSHKLQAAGIKRLG